MKMIVIVNGQGELVAAQQSGDAPRGQVAGIVPGPGQRMHVVDVPDDVLQLADPQKLGDPQAFAARIHALVPRA
jgi:Cu-Zn family superoxide dismutase